MFLVLTDGIKIVPAYKQKEEVQALERFNLHEAGFVKQK